MSRPLAALSLFLALVSVAALRLAAPSVVTAGDPCYHGFEMPARAVAATTEVKLMPCAFAPTVTRIPVGGTVTFSNGSGFVHLVTGANQEWGDRDMELGPNDTVSYTFEKPGIYPFACALHRGMSGTIVVGDGLEAAAGADAAAVSAPGTDAAASAGTGPGVAVAAIGVVLGAVIASAVTWRLARRGPAPTIGQG
jgi:plastocyanin